MDSPRTRPNFGAAVAAAEVRARRSLLRNHGGGHAQVSFLELFVDLVFVFAITQLSGFLKANLDWLGLAQALVMFLAVWWAWMYTTWATNWANPDRIEIRIMLLVIMLLSLVMAVAIPNGFSRHAGLFVGCYLSLQLGRSLFMALAMGHENPKGRLTMQRIVCWFLASGVLWIAGLWRGEDERLMWWSAAIVLEYLGPAAMFWVPGLGRSKGSDWDISGSHMAERCALFIIIALGEGIIISGASFAGLSMEAGRVEAFGYAFLSSVLMWWLYFDLGEKRGARNIREHAEPGRVARNAYTYLHMPIVLGIIFYAVADAKLLAEWGAAAGPKLILTLCGGAALFLAGLGLFKRSANTLGNFPLSHSVGIALFLGLAVRAWSGALDALTLGGAGVAILAMVALWEWVSYNGGWIERMEARGWPLAGRVRQRVERRRQRRSSNVI